MWPRVRIQGSTYLIAKYLKVLNQAYNLDKHTIIMTQRARLQFRITRLPKIPHET